MKRILFLGPEDSFLVHWLQEYGESVETTMNKVEDLPKGKYTFLISYGYRYILPKKVLDLFPSSAINLHISYLPWNRGADPNLWSWIDSTPKGVTIHYLDEGIDTGDIIAQKLVHMNRGRETLRTSYELLKVEIEKLFRNNWPAIKDWRIDRKPQ